MKLDHVHQTGPPMHSKGPTVTWPVSPLPPGNVHIKIFILH